MDADDISLPERFEKQVNFLEKQPDIWAVGCKIINLYDDGSSENVDCIPTNREYLRWSAIINGWVSSHPAAIIRKRALIDIGLYPEDCIIAQDAALWRLFYMYSDFPIANLHDTLLIYRKNGNNISHGFRIEQVETVIKYQSIFYESILRRKINIELIKILCFPSRYKFTSSLALEAIDLLLELKQNFKSHFLINDNKLKKRLTKDVSRKIYSIAYRHPYKCFRYIVYSISINPFISSMYISTYFKRIQGYLFSKWKLKQN